MKTIVHCSGYSLVHDLARSDILGPDGRQLEPKANHGDWEHVCWGDLRHGALGRVPMTVLWSRLVDADQIVWSTGSSKTGDGQSEAEIMLSMALRYDRLLADFPLRFRKRLPVGKQAYRAWVRSHSVLDIESTTTSSSMKWLREHYAKTLSAYGTVLIYLISSANHCPRVHRDAMEAFNYDGHDGPLRDNVILIPVPAQTSYGRKTVAQVAVNDLSS